MPSEMPFRCAFGSWSLALKAAGFTPTKYIPIGARKGIKNKKGVKRRKDFFGYIQVFKPEHILSMKNGYVREHRMIAYDNGILKDLKNEVHHINGIRSDNRINNLQVLTKEKHTSITHKGVKKTNKNHPKCLFCEKNTRSKYQLCSYHYRSQWARLKNGLINKINENPELLEKNHV